MPDDGSDPRPRDGYSAGIDKRTQKITLLVLIGLVLVAAVFLVSFAFSGAATPDRALTPNRTGTPTTAPSPSPTPTVSRAVADTATAPSGPVAAGTWEWQQLGGGECLEPYTTPWAEEFVVVDCGQEHHGQLVSRGTFPGEAAAAWPGEEALTSQLGLLCSAPTVIDYGRAGGYPDVQIQPAYPATEAQWSAGDRSYFCFASLAGGAAMTGSITVS